MLTIISIRFLMVGKADAHSFYLEVQEGIKIHYKIYKETNTFRKPQKRKSNPDIGADTSRDLLRTSLRAEEKIPMPHPGNIIPYPMRRKRTSRFGKAELEQDISEGIEELGGRISSPPPRSTTTRSSDRPIRIVFVLLHSFLGCTASWDRIVTSLRQYGVVLSFDRPGFGLSSRPIKEEGKIWKNCCLEELAKCHKNECEDRSHSETETETGGEENIAQNRRWINPYSDIYSAHIIMRLLHHTLDHEKVSGKKRNADRKIILIGHSQGGRLALNVAHFFPRGFHGVILVNPSLFSDTGSIPGFAPSLFRQVGNSFLNLVPSLVPPRIAYFDYDTTMDEELYEKYHQMFEDTKWCQALSLWGQYRFTRPGLSAEHLLLNLSVPVLVTTGDHDHVVPSKECRRILKILKQGKQAPALYAEFQQTGHCPMEERPSLFVTVVEKYIEQYIKSIAYERGVFSGSASSLIAAYRNEHQDPFREGCIVMDNVNGEFTLLCATTTAPKLPKYDSVGKDLDEISIIP